MNINHDIPFSITGGAYVFPDSRDASLCVAHRYARAAHVYTCGTSGIAVSPDVVACDAFMLALAPNTFAVNAQAIRATAHTDAVAPIVYAFG